MKAVALNRASFVLSLVGVFVAGTLSLGHAMRVQLPCSAVSDCSKVTSSPYAYWLGAPVAYYGLIAYVLLAVLAARRFSKGIEGARHSAKYSLFLSTAGLVASGWFVYASLGLLQARCDWCLASAATMAALFIVQFLLNSALKTTEEVPASPKADFGLQVAGIALAAILLGGQAVQLTQAPKLVNSIERATSDDVTTRLLAGSRNWKGPETADVSIVEFLDFYCPTCRTAFMETMKMVESYPTTLRVAYRHYPLMDKPGHENALLAAVLSEYAGEKGKFWEFVRLVMMAPVDQIQTPDSLFGLLDFLGLDSEEARKRITDENDPLVTNVHGDLEFANEVGLVFTPTFYVVAKNLPTKIVGAPELTSLIVSQDYQALLFPASSGGPLAPSELPEGHSADDGHDH